VRIVSPHRAAAALAVSLAAACSGSDGPTDHPAVDTFTFTLGGSTTTFTDDGAGATLVKAMDGSGGTTRVTGALSPLAAYVVLQPAGATTEILGATFTYYDASTNRMCIGSIGADALEVTRHDTSMGGRVVGSFGPAQVDCTSAPTPVSVSGSFDATHD